MGRWDGEKIGRNAWTLTARNLGNFDIHCQAFTALFHLQPGFANRKLVRFLNFDIDKRPLKISNDTAIA